MQANISVPTDHIIPVICLWNQQTCKYAFQHLITTGIDDAGILLFASIWCVHVTNSNY